MAASSTDKITDVRNGARPNSATVTVARAPAGATLSCNSLTGWPTASKVHFVTYQIDTNLNPIAGTQLDCSGIVSGSDITTLTVIDGTDGGNSVGDVVEMLPTAAWGQDLSDALMNQHSRLGAHVGITNTSGLTTDTLTVTSGTTLPAGDIGTADIADDAVTEAKVSGIDKSNLSTDYNPYKFYAYRDTAQTLLANTKILLNTEYFDTNNNFDAVTNFRYDVPVSGFYQINFGVHCSVDAGTGYYAYIKKSGSNILSGGKHISAYTNAGTWNGSTGGSIIQLTAGDYLELWNVGTAAGDTVSATYETFMSGFLVSRT